MVVHIKSKALKKVWFGLLLLDVGGNLLLLQDCDLLLIDRFPLSVELLMSLNF